MTSLRRDGAEAFPFYGNVPPKEPKVPSITYAAEVNGIPELFTASPNNTLVILVAEGGGLYNHFELCPDPNIPENIMTFFAALHPDLALVMDNMLANKFPCQIRNEVDPAVAAMFDKLQGARQSLSRKQARDGGYLADRLFDAGVAEIERRDTQ